MTGRILRGPWAPRQALPWPNCRPFSALSDVDQVRLLAATWRDLDGYRSELSPGERWYLDQELPAVRPQRPEVLSRPDRARMFDAAMVVLRRRGGWAA